MTAAIFAPELDIDPARGSAGAAAGVAVAALVRAIGATVRIEHLGRSGSAVPKGGEVLACWHRHLLMMPWARRGERLAIMISQHRDGDLAAVAADRLGIASVRGSSTRGGLSALRGLLRKARQGYDLAFAPDGPKGPAGVAKPGVALAAAATGRPIVPVAVAASRCRRLGSWDRMILPLPGCRVAIVYGEPMPPPDWDGTKVAAEELTRRLDAAEAQARRRLGLEADPGLGSEPNRQVDPDVQTALGEENA